MSTASDLKNLLATLRQEQHKKQAFAGSDSSHPSAKADDGNVDPKEGPRGAEHKKDLKDVPGPDNVITAPEAKPDEQNSLQMNMGLQSKAVGTDPANERNYGMKPEDPGTTHPANAEKEAKTAFDQARARFSDAANTLLAKIAASSGSGVAATEQKPVEVSPEQKAAAAGYTAATQAIDASVADGDLRKFASAYVHDYVLAGELAAAYLLKVAEEEEESGKKEEPSEKESPAEGGGGEGGGGGGGTPPSDLVGQMKGDAGGGAGGGGDDIQELASVLAEMGISPQELIAALHASMGGAGGAGGAGGMGGMGGADPGLAGLAGGGAPDPMAAAATDPTKMAAVKKAQTLIGLAMQVKTAAAAGHLRVTGATTTAQVEMRNEVKRAIRDLISPRRQ